MRSQRAMSTREQALYFVRQAVDGYDGLVGHVEAIAEQRAQDLLVAHRRVRSAARMKGRSLQSSASSPRRYTGNLCLLARQEREGERMKRRLNGRFAAVRTEGGLLPPDLIQRVAAGDASLPGLDSASYHLRKGRGLTRRSPGRG